MSIDATTLGNLNPIELDFQETLNMNSLSEDDLIFGDYCYRLKIEFENFMNGRKLSDGIYYIPHDMLVVTFEDTSNIIVSFKNQMKFNYFQKQRNLMDESSFKALGISADTEYDNYDYMRVVESNYENDEN